MTDGFVECKQSGVFSASYHEHNNIDVNKYETNLFLYVKQQEKSGYDDSPCPELNKYRTHPWNEARISWMRQGGHEVNVCSYN